MEQATPIVSEQKKAAIQQATDKTALPQPETFHNRLQASCYTPDLILGALAIFETQKEKSPEKGYNHTYFGGILRNLVDQRTVEHLNTHLEDVYVHHWETMKCVLDGDRAQSLQVNPIATCTRLVNDFLSMPSPAFGTRILFDLKESYFLATQGSSEKADSIRKVITTFVVESKKVVREKRETLLRKLFEWNNFIRMYDQDPVGSAFAPTGNA